MHPFHLIDTTLRDGEQAPGVCFSLQEQLLIAEKLVALGVREIEVRSPVNDPQQLQDLRALMHSQPKVDWLVWCRARQEDVDAASAAGATRIHIAFPTSDRQIATLGHTWSKAQQGLADLYQDAVKHFSFVSAGAQDASRTDIDRLENYAVRLQSWGVQRLRIADTLGLLTPRTTQNICQALHTKLPSLALEFHGHNDLGFATANALQALENGAQAASATILGLGERCGNASLEQLLLTLHLNYPEHKQTYHLELLQDLCETVARAAHYTIPPEQPLCGSSAVRHQSGIHIDGLLKDPQSYQPFDPALIGRSSEPQFDMGSLSGRHALSHILEGFGVLNPGIALNALLQIVRKKARTLKRTLSPQEVFEIFQATSATLPKRSERTQGFSGFTHKFNASIT